MVPPELRKVNATFPVGRNLELASYVKGLPDVEILQHGFSHETHTGLPEFMSDDYVDLHRRALEGREMIAQAFGVTPSFFVPPWGSISGNGMRAVMPLFEGISMGRVNPFRLPAKMLSPWMYSKLRRRPYFQLESLLIMEQSGFPLSRFNSPDQMLAMVLAQLERRKIIVLVNHHWEYFFDWSSLNKHHSDAWVHILKTLHSRPDVRFLTFSELREKALRASLS